MSRRRRTEEEEELYGPLRSPAEAVENSWKVSGASQVMLSRRSVVVTTDIIVDGKLQALVYDILALSLSG